MSRETEKILKELQRFLDSHADEIKSEDDANALAEQFLAEYDQKCAAQQDHAPETADDYLDLAEQATSKKSTWNISARRWSWSRTISMRGCR